MDRAILDRILAVSSSWAIVMMRVGSEGKWAQHCTGLNSLGVVGPLAGRASWQPERNRGLDKEDSS